MGIRYIFLKRALKILVKNFGKLSHILSILLLSSGVHFTKGPIVTICSSIKTQKTPFKKSKRKSSNFYFCDLWMNDQKRTALLNHHLFFLKWKRASLPSGFCKDFPGGSDGKESACNAGDPALILGWGRSPEEGILACRIPWTEKPGGLQSMGSQRVKGHDLLEGQATIWIQV